MKYINEKKELVMISCGKRNIGNVGEDVDGLRFNVMFNGEKLEIFFNVYLGFFLYLSVFGEGFRLFNIRVSIIVVFIDGLIEIFSL